jgi:signal transduction histidine kinase
MSREPKDPPTYFDSPRRTPDPVVARTADHLAHLPLVVEMLQGFPTPALLLDENRQIVALNARALAAFDVLSPFDVHGCRLGEALDCKSAHDMDGGCGTSVHCAECGAAHAIREARAGVPNVRDCRVTITIDGRERSLDFRAFATPIQVGDQLLVLLALEDIADEKRRDALERIFFHDVLGAANAVHGLARLVADDDSQRAKEAAQSLVRATDQLLEEIQAQRDLMLAERSQLTVRADRVTVNEILEAVRQQYRWSPLAEGRELAAIPLVGNRSFTVDRTQLIRSLGNLVRNALEAIPEGATVTLSAQVVAEGVMFQVTNPGVISPPLQLQVFERSFSTKAPRGRGLGTYSVKLMVEQYLMGRVSFVSTTDKGTVFSIWVPESPSR